MNYVVLILMVRVLVRKEMLKKIIQGIIVQLRLYQEEISGSDLRERKVGFELKCIFVVWFFLSVIII